MKRLSPVEKLAREIAWIDLPLKRKRQSSKSQHWRGMKQTDLAMHLSQARWFAFHIARVDVNVLNELPSS